MFRQLSNKMTKLATKPAEGVYYAVPKDSSFETWDITFVRADEVEEPMHWDLWTDYTVDLLKDRFDLNEVDINLIKTQYTGMPRGRIQKVRRDGGGYKWIILHGNDSPDVIRHQVVAAFGLLEIKRNNMLEWIYEEHEKMNEIEKDVVWEIIKGD